MKVPAANDTIHLTRGKSRPSCPYKPDDELEIVHPAHVLLLSNVKLITSYALTETGHIKDNKREI